MYDEVILNLGISDYCIGGWIVLEGLMGYDWVVI